MILAKNSSAITILGTIIAIGLVAIGSFLMITYAATIATPMIASRQQTQSDTLYDNETRTFSTNHQSFAIII